MTASATHALSPIQARLHDILSRTNVEPRNTLSTLNEAKLVTSVDGYETRTLEMGDLADVSPAAPLVHLDPNTPFKTDGVTGRSMVFSTDTRIATGGTGANPSYFRLPSFPELYPYLILYFTGRPAGKKFTVTLDVQVYSQGGSVQISATNNPFATILSYAATGGARVRVPIQLTTTAEGFSSVLIQRVGQTGFDWMGADLTAG